MLGGTDLSREYPASHLVSAGTGPSTPMIFDRIRDDRYWMDGKKKTPKNEILFKF